MACHWASLTFTDAQGAPTQLVLQTPAKVVTMRNKPAVPHHHNHSYWLKYACHRKITDFLWYFYGMCREFGQNRQSVIQRSSGLSSLGEHTCSGGHGSSGVIQSQELYLTGTWSFAGEPCLGYSLSDGMPHWNDNGNRIDTNSWNREQSWTHSQRTFQSPDCREVTYPEVCEKHAESLLFLGTLCS